MKKKDFKKIRKFGIYGLNISMFSILLSVSMGIGATTLSSVEDGFHVGNVASASALSNSKWEDRRRGKFQFEMIRQDAIYLTKRTGILEDEIYRLLDSGHTREDIKRCYTIKMFVSEPLEKVLETYHSEKMDLGLTLKDYDVSREDYEERYEQIFPQDDQTTHDRVKKTHTPWEMN